MGLRLNFNLVLLLVFAASVIMSLLSKKYNSYSYKAAALNTANPRNRAVEWESDSVDAFRANSSQAQISGIRDTPTGQSLYLARPFQITDPACRAGSMTYSRKSKWS